MKRITALLFASLCSLLLLACTTSPSTAEEWKIWLGTVPALFGVMLLGSISHGLLQQKDASNNGTPMSFAEYWSYGREVLRTFITNVLAFAALLYFDQLNFAAAYGIGMGVNAVTDAWTKKGRSQDLFKPEEKR